jgi:hypothetical protein
VQELPRYIPIHLATDKARHGPNKVMQYQQGDQRSIDSEDDEHDHTNRYDIEPDIKREGVGLCHLVHGWIMQAQADKGLYVSGDITHSSTSAMWVASYYYLTAPVAHFLAALFEAFMPDVYEEYRKAFEAGVWVPGDPGPWLGRAIVYKLQGLLHKDTNDLGPSACFPVGFFDGGEMLVPQLGSKFL